MIDYYSTLRCRFEVAIIAVLALLLSVFCSAMYSAHQTKAIQGGSQPSANHKSEADSRLSVSMYLDTQRYKLHDAIHVCVLLTNASSEPFYIAIPLDWGQSAGLSAWAFDSATKQVIEPDVIADAIRPPPNGPDDFVKILPNHILGLRDTFPLKELGIDRPGRFDLRVDYRSPVSRVLSFGLPIWSSEQGTAQSNTITIEVSR